MAQVTMDSKEYLELVNAQRELEQLKKDMVDGFSFKYSENAYQKYHCKFDPVIPDDAKEQIISRVIDECINVSELMQVCRQNNLTVFNLRTMQLTMHWSTLESCEVDLMEYPDFQVAFNAFVEETEEEE